MDAPGFIDRSDDLGRLAALWKRKGAQLAVIYGRRRVGKTALLGAFARGKPLLHWIAYRSTGADLLRDFSCQLYAHLNGGEAPGLDFTYGSFKLACEALAAAGRGKRIGVIIDEFPYLAESDPSAPSVLQAVWDGKLSREEIFLGLSGSRVGMMKKEILGSKAPLYGRATAVINLKPIAIAELGEFFPRYGGVQLVEVCGITGGVPKYFEFISDRVPVLKNIEEAVRNRTTLLTAEADLLLNEEFRETRVYLAILRALGRGALDIGGISSACGLDSRMLSKYVDQLIELNFVRRKVPAGEDEAKSRRGLYQISDRFLNFYFRFIAPHLQDIEVGRASRALEDVRANFDAYIGGSVFEDLCRDWVADAADRKELSFVPDRVGEYWDREMQVDVFGVNHHDRMMILGESKWTNRKVGAEVLDELESKARKLSSKNGYHAQLVLFGRSGFAPGLTERARKRNVILVELKDMIAR